MFEAINAPNSLTDLFAPFSVLGEAPLPKAHDVAAPARRGHSLMVASGPEAAPAIELLVHWDSKTESAVAKKTEARAEKADLRAAALATNLFDVLGAGVATREYDPGERGP